MIFIKNVAQRVQNGAKSVQNGAKIVQNGAERVPKATKVELKGCQKVVETPKRAALRKSIDLSCLRQYTRSGPRKVGVPALIFLRQRCRRQSAGDSRSRVPKKHDFRAKIEPKASKMEPKLSKMEPKASQNEPRGPTKDPLRKSIDLSCLRQYARSGREEGWGARDGFLSAEVPAFYLQVLC